ncbi:Retroelement Polyprotein [Phytophthora megakarya]|uniref:Retroelement Polyprotein n=1 Tax=Phytophthora megakarya TaxID=4795 RepID=A0A225WIZ2_9STRA|nr:Retroelement Polyprotein [Phytophthora megakarya]
MPLSLCVQEVVRLRVMLKGMGIEQKEATRIWEDNHGAIALAKKARTKHVDIKHHFTRETVEREMIKADYIDTKHPFADLLTKRLGRRHTST